MKRDVFISYLRGGGWGRRGVVIGGAVAGIDDDAGFAPGGDEGEAGGGFVELDDEVIEVFELLHELGDFGFEFCLEGTAADDASPGGGIHAGKGGERGLELGDESGRDTAIGSARLATGGGADGDEVGGGGDEVLIAQFLVVADFVVHFGKAAEVAGFFEVASEGAGGFETGLFELVFGFFFRVGVTFGGGVSAGGDSFGGSAVGGQGGEVGFKGQRRIPVPNGTVFLKVCHADAGFDGADVIGLFVVHWFCGFGCWFYFVFAWGEGLTLDKSIISRVVGSISRLSASISASDDAISSAAESISRVAESISRVAVSISRVAESISRVAESISRVTESISRVGESISIARKSISRMVEAAARESG